MSNSETSRLVPETSSSLTRSYSGQNMAPSASSPFYKSPHYLSEASFQTLTAGIAKQITSRDATKMKLRAKSVDNLLPADVAKHREQVYVY